MSGYLVSRVAHRRGSYQGRSHHDEPGRKRVQKTTDMAMEAHVGTYVKIVRNMFPTRVTAWAVGVLGERPG